MRSKASDASIVYSVRAYSFVNSWINPWYMWGRWTTVWDLIEAWMPRMDSRVEESCFARLDALEAQFVWWEGEIMSALKLATSIINGVV